MAAVGGRAVGLVILSVLTWKVGRLGLLQSAGAVGRLLLALGALTMLAGLLLGLDILRCWNAAETRVEPA